MELVISEKEKYPTICLNMIVKNESHIIEKTLNNLCEKIDFDYWVICDTGSTDNTCQIIQDFFKEKNIPGELFIHSWVNFAHNRSLALELAYKKTDLLFIFDADDELHGDFKLPTVVNYDQYYLNFGNSDGISYNRILLINNKKKFQFLSVVHEFISAMEENNTSTIIEGNYYVVSGRSGNRSKNPNKYLDDAKILEEAHAIALKNNDNLYLRYAFYCANSYKDAGMPNDAIKWYKITLKQNNWCQEKYISCINLYNCFSLIGEREAGFFYLVESLKYDTQRVEGLYELLVHYCCENMHNVAYNYYLIVKKEFEENYYNNNFNTSSKLFLDTSKYNFFVPYYMILIADKMQDFQCVIRMYEIIFSKKYKSINEWYINNLIYNLQFFFKHTNDPNFIIRANQYIRFLYDLGIGLHKLDFLKGYEKYGIVIDYIFNKFEINRNPIFTNQICKKSKNVLIYTGFSRNEWNDSYMTNNALGGSEKAVIYLSRCFPSEYNIYISGVVKEEKINNISYVNISNLNNLINTTPFHTVIISRYIGFLEMFPNTSFHNLFIWAHDVSFINYTYNTILSSEEIITKWDKYITGCICLTEWHKNLFSEKYPKLKDKISIINNGICLENFNLANEKIPNKFIYTSCSERGLSILLNLWENIINKLPDATLVISSYNNFPQNKEEEDMQNIINKYPDSIKHLGKLSVNELYNEMTTSEYWLYPCIYPETSCITSLEMMMSNIICLYYPCAGLTDTMNGNGIQISQGNEIENLIKLTNEEKERLKENGRTYAESCSWKNRYIKWHELLFAKDETETDGDDVSENNNKKIAIFNGFPFHYEMFGYIINYCKNNNYKLTIFTNFNNTLRWFEFYKKCKCFKDYYFEFKEVDEFEEYKSTFDTIFLTTDDDFKLKNEWINDKYICIDHHNTNRRPQINRHLALRPFINYRNWCLPCFPAIQISDKKLDNNEIHISIIGGRNDYNYSVINRICSNNSRINIHFISRNINKNLIIDNINKAYTYHLHENINTIELFKVLNNCDYIFTDCTANIDHFTGISMSGSVPLAFSSLTPLIISSHNNGFYKFKNVIEFDIQTSDNIYIEKNVIHLDKLLEERNELMCALDKNMEEIKNTALIVEPRDLDNIEELIHDYKKKLGDNWIIVFYCGKGLKNKWTQCLSNDIEIRELTVNNFTSNEYSDFFKQKELWESLYGDFVLTFQTDAVILNKEPYTIDYFMNLNKSYIGGNMNHNWNELIREKLHIDYRNFNGGLSLRKRLDMIKIIETFGTEPRVDNSSNMKTDAEDVYFTIGCYKLNMLVGHDEICQRFALNTINKDSYFGIHQPSSNIVIPNDFTYNYEKKLFYINK
jgi:hypothetical protein